MNGVNNADLLGVVGEQLLKFCPDVCHSKSPISEVRRVKLEVRS